jgi:spoIIIJ-associated protein
MEELKMPQIEFEGKNIDEAVKNACKQLNCKKETLKFDIVSSGSTGIFGLIGAKKAKIRVIETSQPIKKSKEDHSKSAPSKTAPSEGIKSLVDEAFNDIVEESSTLASSTPKSKTLPIQEQELDSDSDADLEIEGEEELFEEEDSEPVVIPEAVINIGKEMLQKILDSITDNASVIVKNSNGRLIYRIEGGNSALLIGKRGQTLDAMQYLVDKIVNKKSDDRVRIQIDVEGYLESRQASLESLALRLAEKAKKTGKPSTISQMTAHDRRIVHLALKDDHTVKTRSIGEGYYRRLVIFPKKRKFRKNTKYDTPEAK